MDNCIFCKIGRHEISKEFEYEDGKIMAFLDIHPVAPVHILVMPKEHIEDFLELTSQDLPAEIFNVIQILIKKYTLFGRGYKIVINGGGAQIINHLHFHLIGPIGLKVQN